MPSRRPGGRIPAQRCLGVGGRIAACVVHTSADLTDLRSRHGRREPGSSRGGRAGAAGALVRVSLGLIGATGCSVPGLWGGPRSGPAAGPDAAEAQAVFGSAADASPAARGVGAPLRPAQIELSVLHVQVPTEVREELGRLWALLREDVIESETALRLRRNGLRVGVGRTQDWPAVAQIIDSLDDRRVNRLEPVRLPPGFVLSLELDSAPREQTIFYVGFDGVLSGSTWPDSRNRLRIVQWPDLRRDDRIVLRMEPEVRQEREGSRWVRSAAGLTQVPLSESNPIPAAGFQATLGPDEFLLIGPGTSAGVRGLLGRALLVSEISGRLFESYVFLRPERVRAGRS